MKIFLTGASGFVGGGLARYYADQGHEVFGTGRKSVQIPGVTFLAADLLQPDLAESFLAEIRPELVIHSAGVKDVRWCEAHPTEAAALNAELPGRLAGAAAAHGAKFAYLSTDLVFAGATGGYRETDEPRPELIYGKTKLAGERAVLAADPRAVVCRTGGVFGQSSPVFRWLKAELDAGRKVECFTDVRNSPTYIPDLAEMILSAKKRDVSGLLHTVGAEEVSRHEWFRAFVKASGLKESELVPTIAGEKRKEMLFAANSSLNAEKTYASLDFRPRTLAQAFGEMAKGQK